MNDVHALAMLLVEDDPADQKLIKLSLRRQKVANGLSVVSSGEEGLEYLRGNGRDGETTRIPDLILLDWNMPGMGGREFLARVKSDEDLKHIPVIVLTTSDSERDILDSYRLQAAGYVKKPVTLEEFKGVIAGIEDYWFVLCRRPTTGGQT